MIGRPPKCRRVCCRPAACLFKPHCLSADALDEVVLALDEIEALRLADLEGMYQADAAQQMGVSRQTFGKIVTQARKKVATALIDGKALRLGEAFPEREAFATNPAPRAMLE